MLLSSDGQPEWVRTANEVAARLGGADAGLHGEASRGVLDAAARLADRPAAVSAILPSVTLAYMRQSGLPTSYVYSLRSIARLGVAELHLLAAERSAALNDLAGQKVNLGPPGSPTQATAAVLLNRMALRIEPLYLDHDQALAAVTRGQIAAMMLLATAPAQVLLPLNSSARVHFLPVADPGGQSAGLLPAELRAEDYPQLSGGGQGQTQPVPTVGVPLVLACFNWSAATTMFTGLTRLADRLAEHGSGLPGFDLSAEVSGWERFPPVADWLARGRAGTIQDAGLTHRPTPSPAAPGGASRSATDAGRAATQKEKLFQQFLNWRRNH